MLNFNIIEQTDNYPYEEILQDYTDMKLNVKEIQKKYDVTRSQWNTIIRHFKEQGIPLRSLARQAPRKHTSPQFLPKNYCRLPHGKYEVFKTIHGKRYSFGRYGTEQEAVNRVNELRCNKWDGLL